MRYQRLTSYLGSSVGHNIICPVWYEGPGYSSPSRVPGIYEVQHYMKQIWWHMSVIPEHITLNHVIFMEGSDQWADVIGREI